MDASGTLGYVGFGGGRRISVRHILRNSEAQTPKPSPTPIIFGSQGTGWLDFLACFWDSGIRGGYTRDYTLEYCRSY